MTTIIAEAPPESGAVTHAVQRDLFAEASEKPATSLFADLVFDRPLDHAYTYAVPEAVARPHRGRQARARSLSARAISRPPVFASASAKPARTARSRPCFGCSTTKRS